MTAVDEQAQPSTNVPERRAPAVAPKKERAAWKANGVPWFNIVTGSINISTVPRTTCRPSQQHAVSFLWAYDDDVSGAVFHSSCCFANLNCLLQAALDQTMFVLPSD